MLAKVRHDLGRCIGADHRQSRVSRTITSCSGYRWRPWHRCGGQEQRDAAGGRTVRWRDVRRRVCLLAPGLAGRRRWPLLCSGSGLGVWPRNVRSR